MKRLAAIVLLLASGAAPADTVVLMSGSRLTGEAGDVQSGKLLFKSDDLGELKIDVAKIKSLDAERAHVVQYADNSTETKVLCIREGKLWDGDRPLDMANVKATDPVAEKWHGSVNAAFNATRGNTCDDSAAVVASLNRRWEIDRLAMDFGYYYGKKGTADTESEKTTDRWEAELKHDHFWQPKIYNYENLKWERDEIQHLNARYRVGLGGGYQWLDNRVWEASGTWSFNQELGANWIKEEYEGDNPDEQKGGFCALRYGHHFGYVPKWADTLEFFHNAEILPDVHDWEKYLAKLDVGFSTKLVYDFDLLAKLEYDYNSRPAASRKKRDVRYLVGLGYKW